MGLAEDKQVWMNRASLFELLALSFLRVGEDLSCALVSGEYAEALEELLAANDLEVVELCEYVGRGAEDVLHEVRREYTRLFVGTRDPLVSPYAGVWYAKEHGAPPMLFVGKESMAIERFMKSCGVGRAGEANEPLDHIGSMLEFLEFLCLIKAEAVRAPEGFEVPDLAYDDFRREHFDGFAKKFAGAVFEKTQAGVYKAASCALLSFVEHP